MMDPLDSLVFSVYNNKGAYALLLGSGVSRSAAIPTGWEVTLDLIRKLAAVRGEDPEQEPAQWFTEAVGKEPGYSSILQGLAWSKAERQQLLRAYFEPTDDEREQGLKSPTAAHRGIARLAAAGYIRVILTTNFDRLVELALEEVGLTPTVVSTPAQAEGAIPLVHQRCLVVKLHGDYLDPDLKNTEAELAKYHPKIRALLAQVFDEFGLVVCGWSAEWDTALREALERVKGHRFATYWAARSEPKDAADRVIKLRRAQIISIADADTFLDGLATRVESLAAFDRPHPASTALAVEALKRYLVDESQRIRLEDLIHEETERVFSAVASADRFPIKDVDSGDQFFVDRMAAYEALQVTLEALLVAGCYWGEEAKSPIFARSLERLANTPLATGNGFVHLVHLAHYPALRLLYAGGLAAVSARKYRTLHALLNQPRVREINAPERLPLFGIVFPGRVVDAERVNRLTGMTRRTR